MIQVYEHCALIANDTVAITFSAADSKSANSKKSSKDVVAVPPEMANKIGIAFWGGDNLYPQNVTKQLEAVSTARSILDFKAKALYGDGLVYGKVVGRDDKGYEIFEPAQPGDEGFEAVEELFYNNDDFSRFFLEFNQDWTHFGNCFPRLRLSNDGKKVVYLVHEESSDCRYEQMDKKGIINNVYISKYWAPVESQFVKADQLDTLRDRAVHRRTITDFNPELITKVRAIDMYNARQSLKALAEKGERNLILPVNYPSPGKTYYQSPVWDALRLSGWLEVAANIPKMFQALYTKAFKINYHVEVPDTYFQDTVKDWATLKPEEQLAKKKEFASTLSATLTGSDNAYNSLLTFFKTDRATGKDYGRVVITPISQKIDIDKDILLSSVINQEIAFALQMNPAIIGAGAPGKQSSGSGSDIREAWLVYQAMLSLERRIITEPIRLAAWFNGAPKNFALRFINTKLTTLDQNSGTEKILS